MSVQLPFELYVSALHAFTMLYVCSVVPVSVCGVMSCTTYAHMIFPSSRGWPVLAVGVVMRSGAEYLIQVIYGSRTAPTYVYLHKTEGRHRSWFRCFVWCGQAVPLSCSVAVTHRIHKCAWKRWFLLFVIRLYFWLQQLRNLMIIVQNLYIFIFLQVHNCFFVL